MTATATIQTASTQAIKTQAVEAEVEFIEVLVFPRENGEEGFLRVYVPRYAALTYAKLAKALGCDATVCDESLNPNYADDEF